MLRMCAFMCMHAHTQKRVHILRRESAEEQHKRTSRRMRASSVRDTHRDRPLAFASPPSPPLTQTPPRQRDRRRYEYAGTQPSGNRPSAPVASAPPRRQAGAHFCAKRRRVPPRRQPPIVPLHPRHTGLSPCPDALRPRPGSYLQPSPLAAPSSPSHLLRLDYFPHFRPAVVWLGQPSSRLPPQLPRPPPVPCAPVGAGGWCGGAGSGSWRRMRANCCRASRAGGSRTHGLRVARLCVCIHIYLSMYVCMYLSIYLSIYYMYIYTHTWPARCGVAGALQSNSYTHTDTHMHMRARAHTHTHTQIDMRTRTYLHQQRHGRPCLQPQPAACDAVERAAQCCLECVCVRACECV